MEPIVSLEDAKAYLRLDSSYEDGLVSSLLLAAESFCRDVARLSRQEWDDLCRVDTDEGANPVTIRSRLFSAAEALQYRELLRISILYAVGYLFEHRKEADHHGLALTLRNLLFSIREGVV